MFIVYLITNTVNEKKYIGRTCVSKETRFKQHLYNASYGKRRYRLYEAMREIGPNKFKIELVKDNIPDEKILEEETFFIKHFDSYHNGYNMNEGGSGLTHISEEHKKALSQNNPWKGKKRSGSLNPMFNRHHSEEIRKKQSRVAKERYKNNPEVHPWLGKKHKDSSIKKMSESKKGKTSPRKGSSHTEESKQKMSEAKKGKVSKTRKKYMITFPDGHEEIIEGLQMFCKMYNLHDGNMTSVAKGRLKQHKGYKARYLL